MGRDPGHAGITLQRVSISVALALVAPAVLAAPVAAQECSQWVIGGTWPGGHDDLRPVFQFHQDVTHLDGSATLPAAEAAAAGYGGAEGTLSGTLEGNKLQMLVTWPARPTNGTVPRREYTGTIAAAEGGRAFVLHGQTRDLSLGSADPSTAWGAVGPGACLVAGVSNSVPLAILAAVFGSLALLVGALVFRRRRRLARGLAERPDERPVTCTELLAGYVAKVAQRDRLMSALDARIGAVTRARLAEARATAKRDEVRVQQDDVALLLQTVGGSPQSAVSGAATTARAGAQALIDALFLLSDEGRPAAGDALAKKVLTIYADAQQLATDADAVAADKGTELIDVLTHGLGELEQATAQVTAKLAAAEARRAAELDQLRVLDAEIAELRASLKACEDIEPDLYQAELPELPALPWLTPPAPPG